MVSGNGDKSVPHTAAITDLRVQRHGYKGVTSQPAAGEAFSLDFSLWAARKGNHVFDHCLIDDYGHTLHEHLTASQGEYCLYPLTPPAKLTEKTISNNINGLINSEC
ncbi:hypothetical protein K0T92_11470 [Paenibacillus oenotherae]|uniref:Uncharacterized protein n=1 Tax=Paenibacillus oenotherae TaxID=1435645 RepID=A0ABS7D602_9BACL|nr:hypothetical protein [Paenibacillus oenotherae]MBW7475369.1 hypothetical protein [Paenibacillus oenotherae]